MKNRKYEDVNDLFEAEAEQFHKDTGMMRPGKDMPPAGYDGTTREERQKAFDEWHKNNCLKGKLGLFQKEHGMVSKQFT